MNQIEKFLKGLNKKEREAILLVMLQVKKDFTKVPGLTKLNGYKDLFRVRIGSYRLIFRIFSNSAEIIRITKRDEQTYKGL